MLMIKNLDNAEKSFEKKIKAITSNFVRNK